MRKRSLRRTLTGLVAGGLLMPVAACGGAASRAGGGAAPATGGAATATGDGAVPTNVGAACRHGSGSAVSGHAFDQQDAPMEGVEIWIRIVPLNSGLGTFETRTAADGSYRYDVPEGVYQIQAVTPAQWNYRGEIQPGTDLIPLEDNAVAVPPCATVDFRLP